MPAWEIARIPHLCSAAGAIIPDYFNTTFQADLQAYVTAIAQHVATSPYKNNMLYVRIGVGTAGEGYPCLSCSATDMQQLTSWGYSIPSWITWQEQMLAAYKNAFSFVPVIYPLGDSDIDPASGQQVQQVVGYWAAAHGMGVGQQGLNDTPGYANGNIVKIMQYVRAHYPSAYIQFQTVAAVTDSSNVQGDINIANTAGAFSVEWFVSDITNASYQSFFQQWQQMVDQRTVTITMTLNPTQAVTTFITPDSSTTPQANTTISISLCPHGLGNCGDNANSQGGGNTNPQHTTRNVTVTVLDSNYQVAATANETVNYDQTMQRFTGTISLPNLTSGQYLVSVKMDGYLRKQLPRIISVTSGQAITLPVISLVTGDINNDNQLDILDYNLLLSCYGSKAMTASCQNKTASDITDDGTADGADFNLFLRELSVQKVG